MNIPAFDIAHRPVEALEFGTNAIYQLLQRFN